MINRSFVLPVGQQARVLGVSRGSVHAVPRPPTATDLATLRRIDELHIGQRHQQPVCG
jgi:putative transposase